MATIPEFHMGVEEYPTHGAETGPRVVLEIRPDQVFRRRLRRRPPVVPTHPACFYAAGGSVRIA
jgi:hypothetical protein